MSRRYVPTGKPRHTQPPVPTGPRPKTLALAAEARRLIDTAGLTQVQVADRLSVKPKQIERALRALREVGGEAEPRVRKAVARFPGSRKQFSLGWQERAACKGMGPDLFFEQPREGAVARQRREREVQEVCAGCPVRAECFEYSIARPENYGTWGGVAEGDRIRERRRRQNVASKLEREAS